MLDKRLVDDVRNIMNTGLADVEVEAVEVAKNNLTLDGIRVFRGAKGITYYPSKDETAEEIADKLDEELEKAPDFSYLVDNLKDRNWILNHVYPQLVSSYTDNKENPILEGKVGKQLLNMCILYYIEVSSSPEGSANIFITEEMLNNMDVTAADLHYNALHNIQKKMQFMSMFQKITSICDEVPFAPDEETMFVLTTENENSGAALIASENVLEEIHEKLGCEYYILPSSRHEVIIIPARNGLSQETAETFYHIVCEVNATQVNPVDKLTDSVYYYDEQYGLEQVA